MLPSAVIVSERILPDEDSRCAFANSRGEGARFMPVRIGKRKRDHDTKRARRHRRKVAERRRGRAVANLEVVEPLVPEMNAID